MQTSDLVAGLVHDLRAFFEDRSARFGIDQAFLFGSRASGAPRPDSDLDIGVSFHPEPASDDEAFNRVTDIAMELEATFGAPADVVPVLDGSWKPMLYFNVLVLGVPLFVGDRERHYSLKARAVAERRDGAVS